MKKVIKIVPDQMTDPGFKSKQSASILSQLILITIGTLSMYL